MSIDLVITHMVCYLELIKMAKELLLPFYLVGFDLSVRMLELEFSYYSRYIYESRIMAHSTQNYTY